MEAPRTPSTSYPRRRRQSTTLKDIAAETGFSISTVSRALAHNPVIPESTRTIVAETAKRLNYRPNAQAKALRNQKTNLIGVLLPNICNPYFNTLAFEIQQAARAKGYSTILSNTDESPSVLNGALDTMNSQQVGGIIVVPHIQSAEKITELANAGVPIVAADRSVLGSSVPSVTSDPLPAMKEAIRLLSLNNHAKIGYLAGPQDTSTGRVRLEAITSIKEDLRIPSPDVYFGGYHYDAGRVGTLELLDRGVNSILTGDMMMAVGALSAIYSRKLKIGKDVALIGFDNAAVFTLQESPLTVIDQQVETIGQKAFELLYSIMKNDTMPDSVVVPTVLKVRDSHTLT